MYLNKFIIKFFLTICFLYFSLYFFLNGFISLKKNNIQSPLIQFERSPIYQYKTSENQSKIITNDNINDNKKIENGNKNEIKNHIFKTEKIITVKKNDTFDKIINPFFKNKKLKNAVIKKIDKKYDLKKIRVGQKFFIYQDQNNELNRILIPINISEDLIVEIVGNEINISKKIIEFEKEIISNQIKIETSVYADGIKAEIPIKILSDAVRLLSFDVDFQRDIQKDNKLEISYESFYNQEKQKSFYGKIKYINLIFSKNNIEYFFFQTEDGYLNYFNREGKNAQKALMKTPIDGARLSSSFGMRKHPISGYNKMHKGLDFAAPIGTPIYAAGNGVIEYVGRNGGYGKYIRIRHNNSYKTAYAHLNNYKKGIYKGQRVNQGDIIGYVGSTGVSTGPHLHYEVIYLGKQINPKKMNLPSGKILEGNELEKFKIEVKNIYSDFLFSIYE